MTTTYSRNMNSKPKADESQRAKRKCLMCRRDFMSEGPHNRRCKPCRNLVNNAEYGGVDEQPYRVLRG